MAQLPLDEAIPRFKANEERINVFVNGGPAAEMETIEGEEVPSIQKLVSGWDVLIANFLTAKNTEINVEAGGILAGSVAARDKAKDWASKAVDSVVESALYSARHYAAKAAIDRAATEAQLATVINPLMKSIDYAKASYTPVVAPDAMHIVGRAAAGDLGAMADTGAMFYQELAEPPAHFPKFKINLISSAVSWYGFRGKAVVPELLGPPSDALGPIQDCVYYLADNSSLAARNGGVVRLGENTYDIGAGQIKLPGGVGIIGMGRGDNIGGWISRITGSGIDSLIIPDNSNLVMDKVELGHLMVHGPNVVTAIVRAESFGNFHMHDCWVYGSPTSTAYGVLQNAKVHSVNINGITRGTTTTINSTAHGKINTQQVFIAGVAGTTQINGRWYEVRNATTNTFEIYADNSPVNSTGWGNWTSGGTAKSFVTDATYCVYERNYIGGVATGFYASDANSSKFLFNRVTPNGGGRGFFIRSLDGFLGFPNNVTVHFNEVEAIGNNIVGYQFGPTCDGASIVSNRAEIAGTLGALSGTIGFYADAGAKNLHLGGGNLCESVVTRVFDPGVAFYGDDRLFNNVHVLFQGASGAIVGGNAENCSGVTHVGLGHYTAVLQRNLLDTLRYQPEVTLSGTIGFAICTIAQDTVTINCFRPDYVTGSNVAFNPTTVYLSVRAR